MQSALTVSRNESYPQLSASLSDWGAHSDLGAHSTDLAAVEEQEEQHEDARSI